MIFVFVSLSKKYGQGKRKHCHCVSTEACVCVCLQGYKNNWENQWLVYASYASLHVFMCVFCSRVDSTVCLSLALTEPPGTEPFKAVLFSNGIRGFPLSLHKSQVFSTRYLPKVALFQGSIVSLMEARWHQDSNYGQQWSALIILRAKWVICGCCVEGRRGGGVERGGGGERGREEVGNLFSCVIAPSSVTLIISPEQGAKTRTQQENINGLCDIMAPAHSKGMFYYIMGHQQVISHCSLGFIWVYSHSTKCLHSTDQVPICLI